MNLALGIDAVEINRFEQWQTYTHQQLAKFFSSQEIDYCRSIALKSAERFAARFAAKEAFFKAFSTFCPTKQLSLFSIAQFISTQNSQNGPPALKIEWNALLTAAKIELQFTPEALLSLTHTKTTAIACVILIAPNSQNC